MTPYQLSFLFDTQQPDTAQILRQPEQRPVRAGADEPEQFVIQNTRRLDHETNVAAAERAYKNVTRHRAIALTAHFEHPAGLTDFELAALVHISQPSIGKRRLDLERDGLIEFAEETRPAPSGSPARVYRITAKGIAAYANIEKVSPEPVYPLREQ